MKNIDLNIEHIAQGRLSKSILLHKLLNPIKEQPVWIVVIGCLILLSLLNPYFLTIQNLINVIEQSSIIGFMAVGMTFVMINGNIDLSVGSVMTLAAVLVIGLEPHGLFTAILASLMVGIAIGLINGLIITKGGINSFIVTLGAMIGVSGLVFVYTKGQSLAGINTLFESMGSSSIGIIPVIVIIFLIVIVLGEWILQKTIHGRNTYAVGGNYDAAVNAGIRASRNILFNFMLVGFSAAVAGVVLASQMNAATPTLGDNYELWVIIAVALGGTRLSGGVGSVLRSFAGVLIIGILRNGLDMLNVQYFYVLVIMGAILIAVLLVDKQFQPLKALKNKPGLEG